MQKCVAEWIAHPENELEGRFGGASGRVNATTFLAVAQRLRAKGYKPQDQQDILTISTPEHVRFTLTSMGVIQKYCQEDILAGLPFVAEIKDRATADGQVDLDGYDARVKLRRETPMAQDDAKVREMLAGWTQQRKAFRMIRRWTFEGDGIKFDLSLVRSTRTAANGDFRWQRRFKDQDIMAQPPTYEVEVELRHLDSDTPEDALKRLIRGMGEVLRGVQKHHLLIRKDTKERVLAAYKAMTGTNLFRGPALRTLQKKNFSAQREKGEANIRDGYNVTDKADGLRTLGFVDEKGDLFLIDMDMNVYRTGLQQPECRLSLVDGEWVTQTKDRPAKPMQQYLVFDILYAPEKKETWPFPFQPGAVRPSLPTTEGAAPAQPPPPEESRFTQLKAWVETWNRGDGPKVVAKGITPATKLMVSAKEFAFGRPGDDSIFRMAARILSQGRPYYTDGLIFTPNASPLPSSPASTFMEQFKWKPPHDNTIDFLVVAEKKDGSRYEDKITVGVKPDTGDTISYKTLRLYVGGRMENARDLILNGRDLPRKDRTFMGKRGKDYKPVAFTPTDFPDPMASVCNLKVNLDPSTSEEYVSTDEDHSAEPIQNGTIVEMAYRPSAPNGWRWVPLRVRHDKTERYQKGQLIRTLNSQSTANDVWNSIYDPITERMIRTGKEDLTQEELEAIGKDATDLDPARRRYFERGESGVDRSFTEGLQKFHGVWIKEKILYPAGLSGEGKKLVDLACGQANDIHKWRRAGVEFVLGIDQAAKNISDSGDSAYTRYMSVAQDAGGLNAVEPMVFVIGDVSKQLNNGAAGATEEERDILRGVFGKIAPEGRVPQYISEGRPSGILRNKADCVSCMFAVHYFFESAEKFNGLLRNIADTLKVGGYFIGCCFDGQKVFNMLRGESKGRARPGIERGTTLWKLTKNYDEDDIPEGDDAFGMEITVEFATIGMPHKEYLVPFQLLEAKLNTIGCELLSSDELKELGLVNSTATFDVSWDMAKKLGAPYQMGPAAKEFSFLNRWFIFKRKREEAAAAAAMAEAEAAVKANNVVANAAAANGRPAANNGSAGRAGEARRNAAAVSKAAANAAAAPSGPPAANASLAEALAAPMRTVPVAAGPGAGPQATYLPGQVFLFYRDAALKDTLGIKDEGAGRWVSPTAPFPIQDPEDETLVFPTIEHFLAGMQLKLASDKPELARTIFSRDGTIHQAKLRDRLLETNGGTRPMPAAKEHEFLKAELADVKDAMRPVALRKYKVTLDAAKWATVKDSVLREALNQRWSKDARFRKIVEAARNQGKYLLYYTPGASGSNLGGARKNDGRIEGENKVGRIIMELAGFV